MKSLFKTTSLNTFLYKKPAFFKSNFDMKYIDHNLETTEIYLLTLHSFMSKLKYGVNFIVKVMGRVT